MNTIKFNDTEFEVENYNRSTYFSGETISSTANCTLVNANMSNIMALANVEITSLQIYHNNTLIYDLQNISAYMDSTNEYLSGDRMSISLNFTFSNI